MKTQYPNSLTEEKYIRSLNWEFKTPENLKLFSEKQIETPLARAIEATKGVVERFELGNYKLICINNLKRILGHDLTEEEEDKLFQCESIILCQIEKVEDMVKSDIECKLKVPFPQEHAEEYLNLVSKMTRKVVQEICAATEEKISHADKIEYQRLMSGRGFISGEGAHKTFVEKLKEKEDINQSQKRERKVNFVDNVKKKSRVATGKE